jgi:hypothetical protein
MSAAPSVYFILGTPGSGRRALVGDLVENGLAASDKALVLLSESEVVSPEGAGIARAEVRRWQWADHAFPRLGLPAGATVFLLADPLASPIDQLEALKPWLQAQGAELARIFCVVDCRLAEKQPALGQWFEACIRFADVVFLTNREGVANKWLSDFIGRYKAECFPCHFIPVKKGGLPNPALVLDPTPRRLTQYFDEEQDYADLEIEGDEPGEGEDDGLPEAEPYFVRMRSGRRVKELPDIRDYLPQK